MTIWEYKILNVGNSNINEESLNELGKEGWELVSISFSKYANVFFFKRAKWS